MSTTNQEQKAEEQKRAKWAPDMDFCLGLAFLLIGVAAVTEYVTPVPAGALEPSVLKLIGGIGLLISSTIYFTLHFRQR